MVRWGSGGEALSVLTLAVELYINNLTGEGGWGDVVAAGLPKHRWLNRPLQESQSNQLVVAT